eukprot:GFYU01019142.1.p1 GENE.GFYU01019142.1~~GFYU01019142.1.p1  ORF type:complete len:303 (-),score=70.08 GFYU01019142.1:202-1011(-)
MEVAQFRGVGLKVWDLGGRCSGHDFYRRMRIHYYTSTHQDNVSLVYVIDSNDRERYEHMLVELKLEIDAIAEATNNNEFPVLVFCNKQDLPNCMTPQEIEKGLRQGPLKDRREDTWHILGSVATRGVGIVEGFQWLGDVLERQRGEKVAAKNVKQMCDRTRALIGEFATVGKELLGVQSGGEERLKEELSTTVAGWKDELEHPPMPPTLESVLSAVEEAESKEVMDGVNELAKQHEVDKLSQGHGNNAITAVPELTGDVDTDTAGAAAA